MRWVSDAGLQAAEIPTPAGRLAVVRADPRENALELLNLPERNGPVEEVAAQRGYSLLINAAMFAQDYSTSIGYMRNYGRVNNSRISPKLRGFLLFHPKRAGLPAVKLGVKEDIGDYESVMQTHRVWFPAEGILWKKGASVYQNVGLVGVDDKDRVLFFHHDGYYDVHELVQQILDLKLGLRGLLYLDGGHHGALSLAPALGRSRNAWIALPNLLGLKPR